MRDNRYRLVNHFDHISTEEIADHIEECAYSAVFVTLGEDGEDGFPPRVGEARWNHRPAKYRDAIDFVPERLRKLQREVDEFKQQRHNWFMGLQLAMIDNPQKDRRALYAMADQAKLILRELGGRTQP